MTKRTKKVKGSSVSTVPAIPAEYLFLGDELFKGADKIAYRPLWFAGQGLHLDTGERYLLLAFETPQRSREQCWLRRVEAASSRSLIPLAAKGAPITESNSREVSIFLMASESEFAESMPQQLLTSRQGWHETPAGLGFMLGRVWYGPGEVAFIEDSAEIASIADALAPHGSPQQWIDAANACWSTSPTGRFGFASAYAPLCLRHAGQRSFSVSVYCDSGRGKTAVQKVGVAGYGDPQIMVGTFNRTTIASNARAVLMTDLPTMLDERQVADGSAMRLVYEISLERGRERAKQSGGLAMQQRLRTVLITTGEQPLLGPTQDLGGAMNRLLEFRGLIFPTKADARAVHLAAEASYGHAAGPVINKILATGHTILHQDFQNLRNQLASRVPAMVPDVRVEMAAVVVHAGILVATEVLGLSPTQATADMLEAATELLSDEVLLEALRPLAERALDILRDYCAGNPAEFCPRPRMPTRVSGREIRDGMAFIPSEFGRILKIAGIDSRRVVQDFYDRGWLVVDNTGAKHGGHMTIKRKLIAERVRVYCIKTAIWAA